MKPLEIKGARTRLGLSQKYMAEQLKHGKLPYVTYDSSAPAATPEPPAASTNPQPETSTSSEVVYIVKAGDTLSGIAKKYGTTYQVLASYNGIANPNVIRVGQKIRIPGIGQTSTSTPTTPQTTTPEKVKVEAAMFFDKAQARTYTVTANTGLNLRAGAGDKKAVITTLKNGTNYNKVGQTIWLYVAVNGATGYVCKDYLK